MNVYQSFIHKSRYARFLPEKKRREHWPETVDRYFDFMKKHLKEKHSYSIPDDLLIKLRDAVGNMEIMPSMRALMSAGKALDRDNVAGYNCLAGETLVTTLEYGLVPISTLEGKMVHIVDGNGQWTLSECKSYGSQQLYEIHFSTSGKGSFSVRATGNHRWILSNNTEVHTIDLEGQSVKTISMPERINKTGDFEDYIKGVQHGIIYGDGTAYFKEHRNQKNTYVEQICKGYAIRICGDSQPLLNYFEGYTRSYPKSYNGDPIVYIFDRAVDLKDLPDVSSGFYTDSYLIGFLRGWLAADGSTASSSGQVTLTSNKEGSDWLFQYGPRYGFVPRRAPHIDCRSTNLSHRVNPIYEIELDRRWLEEDDFLLEYKRNRFKKIDFKKSPGFGKVINITESTIEKVYCFEVPTTKSFMLSKNILTGNCSYLPIDDPKSFDESMFILMCGGGVGFSVERQYVNQLPEVPDEMFDSDTLITVKDSKEGWCKALRQLVALLYTGEIPKWDLSKLRPAGARLKTFGGRSSGPDPLNDLFKFCVRIFTHAKGRKLTSIECHDIMCKIGEVVVVGGVRRSAMISLSNLSDDRMRNAKSGAWWEANAQRSLSNNSAVYTERPEIGQFMREWLSLYESKSGERGIFNREASINQAAKSGRRDVNHQFGTNPCSEIILRPYGFCNLTEVIARDGDTDKTLKEKIRLAAILGTFQSTLTHFPYLRKIWTKNAEEERLLGVSITGLYDNPLLNDINDKSLPKRLESLKQVAIDANKEFAETLNINPAAAITCVKPSGTVSELVDCASGIHPQYDHYYIRRVRNDNKDPLTKHLIDAGIPFEADVMKPASTTVFSFPKKAPKGAITRNENTAIKHLELWLIYQKYWCEHKPSVTIQVKEEDWFDVGAWVWKNFDDLSGVSFLPYDSGTYRQAPYETITKDEYEALLSKMPKDINWESLVETEDNVEGVQTLACSAGCDIN